MIKEIHSVAEFTAQEDLTLGLKNYFSVKDDDEVVCYLKTGIGAFVGGLPIRWGSYYSFYSYGLMALVKKKEKNSSRFVMPKWSTISTNKTLIAINDENGETIFESNLHLQDRYSADCVYEVPSSSNKDFNAAIVSMQTAIACGMKIKGVFQSNKYRVMRSARGYSMSSRGGMFAVISAKKLPQEARDLGKVIVYTLKPGAEIRTVTAMGKNFIYVINPDKGGYMTDIIDVFMSD